MACGESIQVTFASTFYYANYIDVGSSVSCIYDISSTDNTVFITLNNGADFNIMVVATNNGDIQGYQSIDPGDFVSVDTSMGDAYIVAVPIVAGGYLSFDVTAGSTLGLAIGYIILIILLVCCVPFLIFLVVFFLCVCCGIACFEGTRYQMY